jgi:hypothetical protein
MEPLQWDARKNRILSLWIYDRLHIHERLQWTGFKHGGLCFHNLLQIQNESLTKHHSTSFWTVFFVYVQETYQISKRRLRPLSTCGSQVEESTMLVLTATSSLYSARPANCTPYRPPRAPEGLESSWTPIYLSNLFQVQHEPKQVAVLLGKTNAIMKHHRKVGILVYMNTQKT